MKRYLLLALPAAFCASVAHAGVVFGDQTGAGPQVQPLEAAQAGRAFTDERLLEALTLSNLTIAAPPIECTTVRGANGEDQLSCTQPDQDWFRPGQGLAPLPRPVVVQAVSAPGGLALVLGALMAFGARRASNRATVSR